MAIFRFSAQVIGRKAGRSATAAAAYRAGVELHDERLGRTWDYTRKGGVLHAEILAPDNAPAWMRERTQLWNAVERIEKRRDAQLARDIVLALPHELTYDQRVELVRDFVTTEFVSQGMIADITLHAPDRGGDNRNHHAHVLLTTRTLMGDGFGKKNRAWNDTQLLETWRAQWAEVTNQHLAAHGHDIRIDHRSNAAQGLDREPEPKQGPIATQMEREGRPSYAGDDRRAAQERNQQRADLAQEIAALDKLIDEQKRLADELLRHRKDLDTAEAHKQHAQVEAQLATSELMRQQAVEIQGYVVEQQRAQDAAREDAQRRADEHAREGALTDAAGRYAQALGQHYDIRDPYSSLSRAAMTEYALFKQEQQELTKQIAAAQNPEQRQQLQMQRDIAGFEYMAITSERLAQQSEVIVGRDKQSEQHRALAYGDEPIPKTEAQKLREQGAQYQQWASRLRDEWAERSTAPQPTRDPQQQSEANRKANEQRRNEAEYAAQKGLHQARPQAERATDAAEKPKRIRDKDLSPEQREAYRKEAVQKMREQGEQSLSRDRTRGRDHER